MVRWADVAADFAPVPDVGSLRAIYVPDGDADDWQRVLDLLHQRSRDWELRYTEDGEPAEFPKIAGDVLARADHVTCELELDSGGLRIRGFFFGECHIEFDIEACDVSESNFAGFAEFASALGRAIGRRVVVCYESVLDNPFLVYDPATDTLRRP